MSGATLQALAPILALGATAVALMLSIAIGRGHGRHAALAALGLAAAFGCLFVAGEVAPRPATSLLEIDSYALVFGGIAIAAALVTVGLSYGYLRGTAAPEEYYLLIVTATLGAAVLAASRHFAALFLGIELVSVSLFALIAYPRDNKAIEAGIKYLVLSGHGDGRFAVRDGAPLRPRRHARVRAAGDPGARRHRAGRRRRGGADRGRHRLQAVAGAVPHVDARRV